MKKKIIITAGGTSEPIDSVRSITNQATGRLGALIAKEASQYFDVYLMASSNVDCSQLPEYVTVIEVNDVQTLMNKMQMYLEHHSIFAVIHTMAVSDFGLAGIATEEKVQHVLFEEEELRHFQWSQLFMPTKEEKISSQQEGLYLKLIPMPKVIQYIKQWSEDTLLIGFKLLVNATQDELLHAAQKQQVIAHSDYVVINNQNEINEQYHHASLVQNNHIIADFKTKEEIATGLVQLLREKE